MPSSSRTFALPGTQWPRRAPLRLRRRSWLARLVACLLAGQNRGLWALAAPGAAAGLCAWFVDARALAPGGAICALALLGVAWPWASVRGLRGEMRFSSARAREGDEVEACLALRNHAPWPVYGVAVRGLELLRDGAGAPGSTWGVARAPGRRASEVRHRLRVRRGAYPAPGIVLGSGFPFGLWEASRALPCQSRLLVWPRTFGVGALPEMRGGARHEGSSPSKRAGTCGDVQGARPFREGDSLRRVHWAQTARHDRLIVCEMQATQTPRVEVLLDLDPRAHAGSGADSSREWAIRVAASLCESWAREGASVALRCGSADTGHGSGARHIVAMLDALASVPAEGEGNGEGGAPSLAELCSSPGTGRRVEADLRVVVTTDRALQVLEGALASRSRCCVVALSADAFAGAEPRDVVAPPGVAVLRVTGPQDVAAQVRRGLQEVARAL